MYLVFDFLILFELVIPDTLDIEYCDFCLMKLVLEIMITTTNIYDIDH